MLLYDLDVQADRGQLQGRARVPGLIQPRLRVLPSVAGDCVTGVPVKRVPPQRNIMKEVIEA